MGHSIRRHISTVPVELLPLAHAEGRNLMSRGGMLTGSLKWYELMRAWSDGRLEAATLCDTLSRRCRVAALLVLVERRES